MTLQSYAHQTIAWVKQRLYETDAILSEVEKSAADIKEDAREHHGGGTALPADDAAVVPAQDDSTLNVRGVLSNTSTEHIAIGEMR